MTSEKVRFSEPWSVALELLVRRGGGESMSVLACRTARWNQLTRQGQRRRRGRCGARSATRSEAFQTSSRC